jgi:hypothetical protein
MQTVTVTVQEQKQNYSIVVSFCCSRDKVPPSTKWSTPPAPLSPSLTTVLMPHNFVCKTVVKKGVNTHLIIFTDVSVFGV